MGRTIRVESSRKADVGAPHLRERIWIVADSTSKRFDCMEKNRKKRSIARDSSQPSQWIVGPRDIPFYREWPENVRSGQILRNDDGLGEELDRIRCLGNGQVPQCAAEAWRILSE